jgi:hypothetical protein
VQQGKKISQITIYYTYPGSEPCTIVKIKLRKNSSEFEYDVFFARIATTSPPAGMDVTINWRSLDIENKGVFYTDANAYKMIKRNV